MKLNLISSSLVALLATALATRAQTAADAPAPAPAVTMPMAATNAPASTNLSGAPTDTSLPVATTNAPATTNLAVVQPAATVPVDLQPTNSPTPPPAPAAPATTMAEPAPVPVPAPSTTAPAPTPTPVAKAPTPAAEPHDPNAVIPLIVMDEVPLTDAIKNLARQAGLNYMLDPKINYNAPGPDGAVHPQPLVSLRWENLTADQALSAVLNIYNLELITDNKTHIARITIRDPAAPDPLTVKIIQLKYSSVSNMVISATSVLTDKRSKVIPDNRTSQLVVVATDKEMSQIDELVARLDTATKQVLIEARIVETSKNPTSTKGVDWSGTLQAQHVTFGNGNTVGTYTAGTTATGGNTTAYNSGTGSLPVGSTAVPYIGANPVILSTTTGGSTTVSAAGTGATAGSTTGNSLISSLTSTVGGGGLSYNTAKGFFPAAAFLNADGLSAVLSLLNSDLESTVLSTPRAVTLDNEEATLSVTTAQPIFLTTAGTQGSPGGSQVVYTNLGTILKVTPRISANNTISLKVVPEVSDVAGTITKTVGGLINQADVFDVRRMETRVLIPSGNTLVMGGLVDDNRAKSGTKVPFMGDIPFLGALFRQETKTQNKKNLVIFVTPTIVENEDFQPTESTFLKTKIPNAKASDFGVWDSTTPQDWSKLMHSPKKDKNEQDTTGDIPTTN